MTCLQNERQTWSWPCFHPASSSVRDSLGWWSPPCCAVDHDGEQSSSRHLQPAAAGWTSLSAAAHSLFLYWAADHHLDRRTVWRLRRWVSVCRPGRCGTPCSTVSPSLSGRSFGLETTVASRQQEDNREYWVMEIPKTSCESHMTQLE